MYQWVYIMLKEVIMLNIDSGRYKYVLQENVSSMVVFYVNVHKIFQETIYSTEFGGNERLWKTKCDEIVILFGHNREAFRKYIYTNRCW